MKLSTWAARLPWSMVLAVAGLVAAGCLGIARAEQLAESDGRFLRQQFIWAALAAVAMILVTIPNYRVLRGWSYAALAAAIVLLAVVYFFPPVNGARRWIRVGPVGLQPSEFAKVAFVLALARWLMYRENYRRLSGLLAPLLLTLVPVVLILREPDLGTALVFLPVLLVMLLAAGARKRHLALLCLLSVAFLPVMWTQMSREQKSRVTAMFEDTSPGVRPSDDAFHLHQSKRMLALGGWWGSGRAVDDAPDEISAELSAANLDYYVPAAHTDSIFSVLGQRYGLAGLVGLLGLFLLLIWRGTMVAAATREPFGRLAAIGLVALLGVQVVINTAMLVGLLPITGLSLPLVSYGGSGLVAHAIAVGLILNIGIRPGYELAGEPFRFTGE
ncbi:MAG: FtsW/RodA/SpoVE family cell cycle protein [Planctomycetes bacterium]|nr:FtsW/RodA/SpoVE family cell cycle protein [Planctomycetota bacterium]